MGISLLYLHERKNHAHPLLDSVLYHLSLDRSFSRICADVKKRERFLSVLTDLTDDQDEILYRGEILRDFERNPTLIEALSSLSARFQELRITQKTTGRDDLRLTATKTESAAASKNILETQALCLKRALLFVRAYGECLEGSDLRSQGLRAFLRSCKETYESPDFDRLLTFCSKYETVSAGGYWNFRLALNEEGAMEDCSLIDGRYIHVSNPDQKKKGFSLFKKEEQPEYPCQRILPAKDDLYEGITRSALSDLSFLFGSISEQIFERYGTIHGELPFYDTALRYIQAMGERKIPLCYPTFTADQSITVRKLYDLYLLMSTPSPSEVIPNDFVMESESEGVLLLGNNGSGKTVYLRSVGSAQLLAQAGLPLPCEYAELTTFSHLATQFSEGEKEFCVGNVAGRFEQEVRALATMVDTLQENSLVLLNETFQSTAYAEGAEGLYHLLKHFSALGIRWILVTHLRQLEDRFEESDVTLLHTAETYRILPKGRKEHP